ncbi:N-glycosylase/DNA lyase-like isoform X2 [Lycorma delicatula]
MCHNHIHPFETGRLHCPKSELNLTYTLNGGQSFRWKETSEGQWSGVFGNKLWLISRDDDYIVFKVFVDNTDFTFGKDKNSKKINESCQIEKDCDESLNISEKLLIDYFRLNTSLKELYDKWAKADPNFSDVSEMFCGIRIMKQDPVENIFSFICSSNNFISRISSMVEKLCTFYGKKICQIDNQDYFAFPTVEALAQPGVDEKLRKAGFGYRAKYIHQSAEKIISFGGNEWLNKLKELNYSEAKTELMKLTGVGAKVADCICLMSLGHLEAVPVDTHVFQIASQYYLPHLKAVKSVTTKVYNEIGDHFRTLYGPLAGWAHTILFCADLKKFQTFTQSTPLKRKKLNSGKKTKRRR